MTTEHLTIIIGFLVVCGGGISAGFGKFALWVSKRITDCEADRKELWMKVESDRDSYTERTEALHKQLTALSQQIGRMEGHLEHIDTRNLKIDSDK